jgi:hypothetical protein
MAQKSGNNVKPPVKGSKGGASEGGKPKNPDENLTEQNQFEDTGPLSGERRVGQHQGTGRPPLMKK